ncbi:MAG: ferrous iron transport protein B [Acidobacteria bacterium 13_1_40CM_3_55_6]|nr:MAG: ferrous iron transport protein B [Acidobacteria bacterium 13_1_40CM_3_55_6]
MNLARPLTIAVAGNPNAGKTRLFNSLTGLRQKVANYPGVTVESKTGQWTLRPELPPARLIDLPGLYSLDATSLDEEIARDILLGRAESIAKPDAIVIVVDATNLVRNLYLATQLMETGQPIVLALTMFDLAERSKLKIDIKKLSAALGVAVVPVVAKQRRGLEELAQAVLATWSAPERQSKLIRRYALIEQIVSDAVETADEGKPGVSERIDRVVTHKFLGPAILLLVLLLVFQTIFSLARLPMNLIDHVFGALAETAHAHLPAGVFTDLLADGIIAGVGAVLAFLPQILLLFLFISILEDSGYMARAAFLMDRLMRAVGLHGKAFVPLLSSFACAVPGIMATRTIENPKDRIATIMIAPFMSCSARLPVYTLMIAAFFSGQKVLGVVSLGALIILAMYVLGIAVAIIVAWILKHTILNAPPPPFVMELPPYRLPDVGNVAHTLLARSTVFLKRAGTVILSISILLWALVAFPRAGSTRLPLGEEKGERALRAQFPTLSLPQGERAPASDSASQQIQNSFAGRAGRMIEPVIAPLGFDWKIGIGLISSFAARETIISTLSIVYNVGETSDNKSSSLVGAMQNAKRPDGSPVWTPLVGISLMLFFLLACQCMSTVAIVRRETNSWRWPLLMVGYMLVLAYLASFVTYQGGRLLGFS